MLRPGVISIYEGDVEKERIFVNGGFVEVSNDKLTVLAEEAIHVDDLNRSDLEQRIQDLNEDIEDAEDDEVKRRAAENNPNRKERAAGAGMVVSDAIHGKYREFVFS